MNISPDLQYHIKTYICKGNIELGNELIRRLSDIANFSDPMSVPFRTFWLNNYDPQILYAIEDWPNRTAPHTPFIAKSIREQLFPFEPVLVLEFLRDLEVIEIEANFVGNPLSINESEAVTFTDTSTGDPTSWLWSFPGGTPATSTAQNPVITYAAEGTYSVSLTASNSSTSNQETKTNYITVGSAVLGILTKPLDSSGGGADFYTYTITDMTINGGDAIDMNDIALDATCVGDIEAALTTAGVVGASVLYFAGENAAPFNSFDIAISIAQVPDDTTVSFNLIRTGFVDPTPTPEVYELTMYSTRVSWTATFTTAEPENASCGFPSMISGNRITGLDQVDTTNIGSWEALLTACNDFGFTVVSVVKDSPTQTTVTVEDSLTAISEFWITDAANIPIQQSVVTTPI